MAVMEEISWVKAETLSQKFLSAYFTVNVNDFTDVTIKILITIKFWQSIFRDAFSFIQVNDISPNYSEKQGFFDNLSHLKASKWRKDWDTVATLISWLIFALPDSGNKGSYL